MVWTYGRWRVVSGILLTGVVIAASGGWAEDAQVPSAQETTMPAAIQDHATVQIEYTLTADGQVVDSTDGRGPFQYVQGRGQIIPGLERQLLGLHVGDAREITVKPEEAYGPADPSAFIEVPKEQLPPNLTPKVGAVLRGADPEGRAFRAIIHEIKDTTVMLDLNHPLAGKTLLFKIKVVDIAAQ